MRLALVAAAAAAALLAAAPASAQTACKGRISADATGQGILGAGTQNAKLAAAAAWEGKAKKAHGSKYASLSKAKAVNYDCRSGTLQAKCVLTAIPCR